MILQDTASKCSSCARIASYFMLILYETRLLLDGKSILRYNVVITGCNHASESNKSR